jgi:sterol desaturase/sphingolipid hydroxylase (fatty acid hydroxylase superfamily)
MSKPYPSLRVFKSDFVEWFTHVHPIVPLLIWAPFSATLLWRSFAVRHLDSGTVVGLGAAGLLFWTLAEYVLHRYVFHFHAESPLEKRFQFIIHGLHHSDPVDPTRLVMPPFAAVVLCVILYSLFRLVLGPALVEPFFALFIVGYLCYDYMHFAIHHFNPRTRIGKAIKKHHMLHHFADHHARWGVSSPLWDYVFGTVPEAGESGASPGRDRRTYAQPLRTVNTRRA